MKTNARKEPHIKHKQNERTQAKTIKLSTLALVFSKKKTGAEAPY